NLQVAIGVIVVLPFEIPEMMVDTVVRSGSQQHERSAMVEAVMDRVRYQRHPLLKIQPPEIAHHRLEILAQPEALTQHALILILPVQGSEAVTFRDVPVVF